MYPRTVLKNPRPKDRPRARGAIPAKAGIQKLKMKRINRKTGFTLIELLVVIAIIAILSGVILTFLMSARNKSKDSAIKQQLNHLRTQANIYLPVGDGNSVTDCVHGVFVNPAISPLLSAIPGAGTKLCAHSAGTDFIVIAKLASDSTKNWCVDSSNNSKLIPVFALPLSGYICP